MMVAVAAVVDGTAVILVEAALGGLMPHVPVVYVISSMAMSPRSPFPTTPSNII